MTPFELKVLRKTLGLSQEGAAKVLGIDRITYWRKENEPLTDGSSSIKPGEITLLKLAKGCPHCGKTVP